MWLIIGKLFLRINDNIKDHISIPPERNQTLRTRFSIVGSQSHNHCSPPQFICFHWASLHFIPQIETHYFMSRATQTCLSVLSSGHTYGCISNLIKQTCTFPSKPALVTHCYAKTEKSCCVQISQLVRVWYAVKTRWNRVWHSQQFFFCWKELLGVCHCSLLDSTSNTYQHIPGCSAQAQWPFSAQAPWPCFLGLPVPMLQQRVSEAQTTESNPHCCETCAFL